MVKTYSKKANGAKQLSPHFAVREFACSDGSDTILIDTDLITLLERIRTWAGASIRVTSGYRTKAYNTRIGGASRSQHTLGTAADIVVSGKTPADVARFAEAVGAGGVGLYTASRFVHVDVRDGRARWVNRGAGDVTVHNHGGVCPYAMPTSWLGQGSTGDGVKWVQWWCNLWGCGLVVDGDYGRKTEAAVRAIQTRLGLAVDGITGTITRKALTGVV